MYKMILSSVAAVILFVATVPGPAVASCGVAEATAPAAAQSPYGWRLAGKYHGYQAACRAADELEACGYEARVVKCGYYYCVYCR